MKRFKRLLRILFLLPPLATVLVAVPSLVLVFVVLGWEGAPKPLAYASYFLSAYGLVVLITGFKGVVRSLRAWFEKLPVIQRVKRVPLIRRYLEDTHFKTLVSTAAGLLLNLAYAAMKLTMGVLQRSAWLVTLAVYYIFLCILRLSLVEHIRCGKGGAASEWKRYRFVGIVLLLMNLTLAAIVFAIVAGNRSFSYPGLLIYAMAFYAFYAVISAIIRLVKYRRYNSPILSAARAVSLTTALVSMLSLETAMLATFGGNDPQFRRTMTASFGGVVCAFVLSMSVYMIFRAAKGLRTSNRKSENKASAP